MAAGEYFEGWKFTSDKLREFVLICVRGCVSCVRNQNKTEKFSSHFQTNNPVSYVWVEYVKTRSRCSLIFWARRLIKLRENEVPTGCSLWVQRPKKLRQNEVPKQAGLLARRPKNFVKVKFRQATVSKDGGRKNYVNYWLVLVKFTAKKVQKIHSQSAKVLQGAQKTHRLTEE